MAYKAHKIPSSQRSSQAFIKASVEVSELCSEYAQIYYSALVGSLQVPRYYIQSSTLIASFV